jgi:O-antigen/teichoic acid export membrane protein
MKTFFSIVFFKIFQFSKLIGNADDDSYAFKSVAILSLFISLNFFAVVAYYRCWIKHVNEMQFSRLIEVLIVLAIGILVYFIFYRGEKYKIYFEKVVQQSKFKGRKGTWLTIFYMIGSIALLASTIWLKCNV